MRTSWQASDPSSLAAKIRAATDAARMPGLGITRTSCPGPSRPLGAACLRPRGTPSPDVPAPACSRSAARSQPPRAGIFDFFKEDPEAKARKEEEFQRQQEVLQRRRTGKWKDDVEQRRNTIKRYNRDKDFKKQVDDKRRASTPKKKDPPLGGFIIPIAPFDIPEYDNGERFDLRLPYVDKGWVDESADVMKSIGKMFGGGGKNEGNNSRGGSK